MVWVVYFVDKLLELSAATLPTNNCSRQFFVGRRTGFRTERNIPFNHHITLIIQEKKIKTAPPADTHPMPGQNRQCQTHSATSHCPLIVTDAYTATPGAETQNRRTRSAVTGRLRLVTIRHYIDAKGSDEGQVL